MGSVSRIYFSNARSLRRVFGDGPPPVATPSRDLSPASGEVPSIAAKEAKRALPPPRFWRRRTEAGPPPSRRLDLKAVESSWNGLVSGWIGRSASRFGKSAPSRESAFLSSEALQAVVLVPCRSDQVELEDVRDLLRMQRGLRSVGLGWSVALACEDRECFVLPSLKSEKVDVRLAELWRRGHDEDEIALLMAAEFPTNLDPSLARSVPWPTSDEAAQDPPIESCGANALSDQASLEWVIARGHECLRRGKPMSAVKLCQRHGLVVGALGETLDEWIERVYSRGSYGELLAFVRAAGMYGPYSAVELLTLAAERGDAANFLKQAHALGIYAPLRESIDAAIARREAKGTNDVDAWRRKFQEIEVTEEARG